MRALRILLLLGAASLQAGCGLPDAYYLVPPIAGGVSSTGQSLTIPAGLLNAPFYLTGSSRASDINVNFTGYELYYKCYNAVDTTGVTADQNFGSSSYTVNDLLQHGFLRVCRGPGSGGGLAVDTAPGTGNAPLVDINHIDSGNLGSTYTIAITVNNPTPPSYGFTTLYGGNPIPVTYFEYFPPSSATSTAGWEIRRFVQADTSLGNVCKTYTNNTKYPGLPTPNWYSGDQDIASIYASLPSPGLIYVMIYAVSYGIAVDGTFRTSYPTWLGYTEMQVLN